MQSVSSAGGASFFTGLSEHPEFVDRYKARRKRMDEHLKEHNPAAYDAIIRLREKEHTKEK